MLMMTIGYQEAHAELHGVPSEDLAGQFRTSGVFEQAKEVSRLRGDVDALEAKASALGEKVASLDKTLAAERRKHRDLIADPFWKLTTLLRRIRMPATQAAAV